MMQGVDVSNNNGATNWPKVLAAGFRFGFAKVSEGSSFADGYWQANREGMRAHGFKLGGYHFARPSADATAQARRFVELAGLKQGEALVLDLELNEGLGPAALRAWAERFLSEVRKAAPGLSVGLYTYSGFVSGQLGGVLPHGFDWLWLANYPRSWSRNWSILRRSAPTWPTWQLWQFTSSAKVPGVGGNCDLSVYPGNAEQLAALFHGKAAPKPSKALTPYQRLTLRAKYGPNSARQLLAALAKWHGKPGTPDPGDSAMFKRLRKAGFGAAWCRKFIYALREARSTKG